MHAEIISIGTELTAGLTVDTNSAWISQRLAGFGVGVTRHATLADDESAIADAVRDAARRAEIIVVNGGLGPTADDVTRQGLAVAMGVPLVSDPPSVEQIRGFFKRLGRSMPVTNERQAFLPAGSRPLPNRWGTAPGISARLGNARIFVLPGVPAEMKAMFEHLVEPELLPLGGGATTVTHTLNCFGASESHIGEQIEDLMAAGRQPTVGLTADEAVIRVRILARGASLESATDAARGDTQEVRRRLGTLVFGEGSTTLQDAVAALLIARGETIATAESCTGGLLGKRLTDVAGSSAYFLGGFITYANQAKTDLLGVDERLIRDHGAVSEPVAESMAHRCREILRSTYALAITGIAGPGGGTDEKPVGLVYLGLAGPSGTQVKRIQLGAHLPRASIRDRSVKNALDWVRSPVLKSG